MQEGFTTIRVKFEGTQRLYTYKALLEDKVKEGDYVVVDTPSAGLQLCEVHHVDRVPNIDVDADFDYKWIVQKVDRSKYDERIEREEQFHLAMQEVEREKKRAELRQHFLADIGEDSVAKRILEGAIKSLNQEIAINEKQD